MALARQVEPVVTRRVAQATLEVLLLLFLLLGRWLGITRLARVAVVHVDVVAEVLVVARTAWLLARMAPAASLIAVARPRTRSARRYDVQIELAQTALAFIDVTLTCHSD